MTPEDELAQFTLGQALFEEGSYGEAAQHLAKALELNPEWMMAAILLGKSYLELGRTAEAKAAFEKALHLARVQHHADPAEEIQNMLKEL